MPDTRTHRRTCPFCEAMCGLTIEHRGAEILSIKANRDDVLSRGHICAKAVALRDVHEDVDRLRQPVRRTPDGWTAISWREAFDLVQLRVGEVRRRHGNDALAVYAGNPTVHNLGATVAIGDFIRAVQTRNLYSATSVDQLPHMVASWAMFGHQFLLPVPDIDRTQLFVCIGGNPVASGGSLMSAPGFERRVAALRSRGGRFVVVDPRRTESAAIADLHLPIRPGADVYLLLAWLRLAFEQGTNVPSHLASRVAGLDALRTAVERFDPDTLVRRTGLGHDDVAAVGREICTASRAVVYGRVGACTQPFGGLAQWLIQCLNVVTGRLDCVGGAMFAEPAVDLTQAYGSPGHRDRFRSRVRGLPEFGNELPVATLADEILTPGPGQVRALVTFAGNPVLSTPNGRQLDRALDSLDFMAAIDFYVNETTRHADVIMPPTSPLEHGHFDIALGGLAVHNVAKYSPPLFPRPAHALHDHEILWELAERLQLRGRGAWGRRLRRWLGPERLLDLMLRTGRYGHDDRWLRRALSLPGFARQRAALEQGARTRRPQGMTLGQLVAQPDGVDLGALRPCLEERLGSRAVELAPGIYVDDLARAAAAIAEPECGLQLIGRRDVRSNNSWLHNSARLVKGKPRCTLLMHPADAQARSIVDGERVRLSSRVGSIEVPVQHSIDMRPGVVSLPHGWGHDREGVRLGVAREHAGASINDVVDDQLVDALTGTAVLNGTRVEVTRIAN
jgi:anaerobic selenocysteine-containing dehydrogenase